MNQLRLVQQTQAVQELLRENSHKRGAQSSELVLLDELVQVHREQFEDQAQVLFVNKCILQSQNVVVIVLVHPSVQQIQHRHLHHTLVEVSRLVLDHLDCNHLLCFQVLTLHDLAEGALA